LDPFWVLVVTVSGRNYVALIALSSVPVDYLQHFFIGYAAVHTERLIEVEGDYFLVSSHWASLSTSM
jgi:hypothetical protein